MKIKFIFILSLSLLIILIISLYIALSPKKKDNHCQVNGQLNSTLDVILPFSCNLKANGYVNLKGEIILIEETWSHTSVFADNNFAIVTNYDNKDAIINKKGKYILDYEYEEISYLGNNFYFLKKESEFEDKYYLGKYKLGSIDIQEVPFEYIYDFSDEFAAVIIKTSKKIGYIDESGQIVIPAIYDKNPLIKHQFINKLAVVIKDGRYGVIDQNNEVVVPFKYDYIQADDLNDKYLKFSLNGKWGVMDNSYNEIIPPIYKSIGNDSYDIVSVSYDNEFYAFLNLKTKMLITDFIYKIVITDQFIEKYNYFQNNYAVVSRDSVNLNLLDLEGTEFFKENYKGIKIINSEYILLKVEENLFCLYNLYTKTILEFSGYDILIYPKFNVLAVLKEKYVDGASVYQLFDFLGNEIIDDLKVYDDMIIKNIEGKEYLYFNGELDNHLFSSYFDEFMNTIWVP